MLSSLFSPSTLILQIRDKNKRKDKNNAVDKTNETEQETEVEHYYYRPTYLLQTENGTQVYRYLFETNLRLSNLRIRE
jgi:hypothetical protein